MSVIPAPDDASRLDPRSITVGRIGGWIFVLVLAAFTLPGLAAALILDPKPGVFVAAAAALMFFSLLGWLVQIGPVWRYRHTWYRIDVHGIEIARGRVWQRLITVPHARVQHIDVVRGPFERRFGLATLVIYTAGHANSEVKIEGLSHESALALRERLVKEKGVDAV
jgi:membrane protein YdbS with pleckstrin-like domain